MNIYNITLNGIFSFSILCFNLSYVLRNIIITSFSNIIILIRIVATRWIIPCKAVHYILYLARWCLLIVLCASNVRIIHIIFYIREQQLILHKYITIYYNSKLENTCTNQSYFTQSKALDKIEINTFLWINYLLYYTY